MCESNINKRKCDHINRYICARVLNNVRYTNILIHIFINNKIQGNEIGVVNIFRSIVNLVRLVLL